MILPTSLVVEEVFEQLNDWKQEHCERQVRDDSCESSDSFYSAVGDDSLEKHTVSEYDLVKHTVSVGTQTDTEIMTCLVM